MTRGQDVLIVDDNKLICWGLKKLMTSRNLSVTVVDSAKEALSELQGSHYHSVFLDINLPDMNGLDVLREIRRISPAIKVVVMTSDDSDGNRQKALEGGAYHFILKPFGIPEVVEIVQNLGGSFPVRDATANEVS